MRTTCDDCGTRDPLFHSNELDLTLCCECTGAFVSWVMDGGIIAEPDMYEPMGIGVTDDGKVVLLEAAI